MPIESVVVRGATDGGLIARKVEIAAISPAPESPGLVPTSTAEGGVEWAVAAGGVESPLVFETTGRVEKLSNPTFVDPVDEWGEDGAYIEWSAADPGMSYEYAGPDGPHPLYQSPILLPLGLIDFEVTLQDVSPEGQNLNVLIMPEGGDLAEDGVLLGAISEGGIEAVGQFNTADLEGAGTYTLALVPNEAFDNTVAYASLIVAEDVPVTSTLAPRTLSFVDENGSTSSLAATGLEFEDEDGRSASFSSENITLVNGDEGAGKVLTSDAGGRGTWAASSGGHNWTPIALPPVAECESGKTYSADAAEILTCTLPLNPANGATVAFLATDGLVILSDTPIYISGEAPSPTGIETNGAAAIFLVYDEYYGGWKTLFKTGTWGNHEGGS